MISRERGFSTAFSIEHTLGPSSSPVPQQRFGFQLHPAIKEEVLSPHKLRAILPSIIYSCGIDDLHVNTKMSNQADQKEKARRGREEAALLGGSSRVTLTYPLIMQTFMQDHIVRRMTSEFFYSCPAHLLEMESLTSVLGPPKKLARRLPLDSSVGLDNDVAASMGAGDIDEERWYFKLAVANPGLKKCVRAGIGSAGSVARNRVLVTLHARIAGAHTPVVTIRPTKISSSAEPTFLIHGWQCPEQICRSLLVHSKGSVKWTTSVPISPHESVTEGDISELISFCMDTGAHPHGHQVIGQSLRTSHEQVVAEHLCRHGVLVAMPNDRWALTDIVQNLTLCEELGVGRPFFALAEPGSPLSNMTNFELLLALDAENWKWQKLKKPGPRNPNAVVAYEQGADRIWCSRGIPLRNYMLCLLKAEDSRAVSVFSPTERRSQKFFYFEEARSSLSHLQSPQKSEVHSKDLGSIWVSGCARMLDRSSSRMACGEFHMEQRMRSTRLCSMAVHAQLRARRVSRLQSWLQSVWKRGMRRATKLPVWRPMRKRLSMDSLARMGWMSTSSHQAVM